MKIVEVEAKQKALEAELTTALEAAKVLTPATAEFDEAYSRYLGAKANIAKIPEELAKARQSENAEAIAQCGTQVGEAIGQLIVGLKVADLLGVPVTALRYAIDAEGKVLVVFNPVTKVRATGGKREAKGGGRTVIVDPEGNRLSLTKFVLAHATDAEKASPEYKYPHSQVSSKPKFEEFCQTHSLTGFTYELPQAGGADEAAS